MRLLVLGGNVYLSKLVASLAFARGDDVTVANRGKSGEPVAGVRTVPIDRSTTNGLDALRGEHFDAVIDVARIPRHVRNAMEALSDRTGHWVFVSTGSVYADQSTPGQYVATAPTLEPVDADSADPSQELYGRSKVTCENLIHHYRPNASMIARAGLIVGPNDPNDRFGYWVERLQAAGEILAPGNPNDDVQFIDVYDLAQWLIDAAHSRTVGTFDAVCPPMSRLQFLTEIGAAVGNTQPDLTWISQETLERHGIAFWAGTESLGLWVPLPEYGGHMSRVPDTAVLAGMRNRPISETVHDWRIGDLTKRHFGAYLSRGKEAEVLRS